MKNILSFPLNSLNILTLPSRIAKKIKYGRSLHKNHVVEDVFLVSYPKSGNTWLRFLIANAIKVHYRIDQDVNFFTIEGIIPSPRGKINLQPTGPFGRTDLSRIIKSHSAYHPYYYRVILLVRDPRDVMVSYYHYLKGLKRISEATTISELIRDDKYGIMSWVKHSKSWYFDHNPAGQRIKIFRYEDFLEDTKLQLFLLMEYLGIIMDNGSLEEAITLSSKERMKASELKHASLNLVNEKMSFVRQGLANRGRDLSDSDRKFIEDSSRDIAGLLGYNF
ncbi:sulfotransferase domain-containing protein [Microcystis aeruginosa]|uniref:Sulfotransferase n=1 Tax=Microcystis aeruginosa PCC 9717 TaxID=1160286 RepID=I4FLV7_MICAE|nr:sulfotransferase domain-containing protein [Microcystis aeruginosa]CCH96632.1 Sulfotransferase [Microcystis aeruginosa PCC 9717]